MTLWPAFPLGRLLAAGAESGLRPLLVQLVVIIVAARLGAIVARRLRQPAVAGVALPFTLGMGLAWAMVPRLDTLGASAPIDPRSVALFLGVAMSITAIPILGRILIEPPG